MTGLDTIHLTLPANEVQFDPCFVERLTAPGERSARIIQNAGPDNNMGLFRDTSGAIVSGVQASINADAFQFFVRPHGDTPNVSLQFSGAAFTGDNILPVDDERLRAVVPLIVEELESWGVSADWESARLGRVDVARNLEMAHTVPVYHDLWRGAAFRYGVVPSFTPGTFNLSLGTGRAWPRQWGTYDKGLERDQKAAKGAAKRACAPSKLARFELRQRAEAVARVLRVERPTLGDLMAPGAVQMLAVAHRASARDDLLSMLPETDLGASGDETRLAALLRDLAQDNTPARFNADAARVASLLAFGGFAGAVENWESSFAPILPNDSNTERERKKRARSRERREMRRVSNLINMADASTSGPVRSELLGELRDKLLSGS